MSEDVSVTPVQEAEAQLVESKSSSDESSSLSRWVCEVNDSWRSVEKLEKSEGSTSDSNNASVSADKKTTETGMDASSSQGPRVPVPSSDSDEPSETIARQHQEGRCNPCVFHNSLLGCDKGRTCSYCHFDHNSPPTGQNRPRKITRDSFKKRVLACFHQPRDQVHDALQAEALHPYAQGLIRGYLDAQAEQAEQGEPLEPGEVTNR